MKKIETGIFSGSFNPIHAGHLMLANYLYAFTPLEEIWFVISPHNPLKNVDDLLSDGIRLELVRLALEDYDQLIASDMELKMPRPSYTIDTLTALTHNHPDRRFSLIIGGDNWTLFNLWKEYKRILELYPILIYPRMGENIHISEEYGKSVQLINAPVIEVSSTFIRKSIEEGKDMRAFLPPKVYEYIQRNQLYRRQPTL